MTAPNPDGVTAEQARRLLLAGQGLLADPARPAPPAAVYRQIESMGFVQIDSIAAVLRAHHHILATRFDAYRPEALEKSLTGRRRLFEHWTHDASIIPTSWLSWWRLRFARYEEQMRARAAWAHRMDGEIDRTLDDVRGRIQREGPLRSADFEDARGPGAPGGMWNWKPHKAALEWLWRSGELSVAGREGFQKRYDFTDRIFPGLLEGNLPAADEHLDWACRSALERLTVATPGEIAAFLEAVPIQAARAWCEAAAKRGEVRPVIVEAADGSKPRRAFALDGWRRRVGRLPPPPARIRPLSPFDPVVRDRKRLLRAFGFEYRVEIFVPARKRRYGYYVLPLLEGDTFIGRADAKAHRDRDALEILGLWWEPGVERTPARRRELEAAFERLASQIPVSRVTLSRKARSALRT